jgi:hypothetical protein
MAALRQSIKEASEGQAVSWDQAKQELNRDISN